MGSDTTFPCQHCGKINSIPHREGWLPVTERLPEPGQDVAFVVDREAHGDAASRRLGGRFYGVNRKGQAEFTTPGVTWYGSHWMPLPPLPTPPEVKP
jgi:hypothetical protein